MPKWKESILIKKESISSTTSRFLLKIEDSEKLDFIPGQFITLDLPISEKRIQRWRSYSIANIPNEENIIELCIVRLPEGKGTSYLFDKANEGDVIPYKGPSGMFTLPKKISEQTYTFICTGTGIAPFMSMLRYIDQEKIPFKGIHLIFGTRQLENILYRQEIDELVTKYPQLAYDICLSREEDWTGHKGYVHQVYLERHKTKPTDIYMLCGWSGMIDEAVNNLKEKCHIDEQRIIYELYG